VHEEQDVAAGPCRGEGEARAPGSFAFDDRRAGFSKSSARRGVGPAVGDEDLAARVADEPRKTLDDVETLPSNGDDDGDQGGLREPRMLALSQ
jgi:hypothetical protein